MAIWVVGKPWPAAIEAVGEELGRGAAPGAERVEVLEHAVDTRDVGQVARVLPGTGVGIVGLPHIQQPKGRPGGVEMKLVNDRRHVVVGRHQLVRIKIAVDRRELVQHRH